MPSRCCGLASARVPADRQDRRVAVPVLRHAVHAEGRCTRRTALTRSATAARRSNRIAQRPGHRPILGRRHHPRPAAAAPPEEQHPDAQLDVLAPAVDAAVAASECRKSRTASRARSRTVSSACRRVWRLRAICARGATTSAVVLPNSFKSALIPWIARIPLRTGYVGEFRYGLLNDARRLDPHALPTMADRYAALAQPSGTPLHRPLPPLRLSVDPGARQQLLHRLGVSLSAPVVCICPGAEYGPAKRWPVEHFAQLARQLRQTGFQVWVVGSNKDRDLGAEIAQRAAAQRPT